MSDPTMKLLKLVKLLAGAAGGAAVMVAAHGCATDGSARENAQVSSSAAAEDDLQMLVRLTRDQYLNSIADIFGPDIKVGGRFDPETRVEGLLAIGSSEASISPAGAEQYLKMARDVASQVVDEAHREKLLSCKPKDAGQVDETCASQTLTKYGRLLFRRPLTSAELGDHLAATRAVTARLGDFYSGLEHGLVAQLTSAQFVFMHGVRDRRDGRYLDDYAKATRLSYFLWNTTPDDELLHAAERGELSDPEGRARQVARLLASPRVEMGVRAFFTDFPRPAASRGYGQGPGHLSAVYGGPARGRQGRDLKDAGGPCSGPTGRLSRSLHDPEDVPDPAAWVYLSGSC